MPSNHRPNCQSCEILFIGSSYLSNAGNDVVEIFKKMASGAKKQVYVDHRIRGGKRLYDHIENPLTIEKINERKWDYIILQGNSAFISKEKWHYLLTPYLEEFKKVIKSNSKKTCMIYMMPWACTDGLAWMEGETDTYEQMQENIFRETAELIKEMDIATAPAGWSWYISVLNNFRQNLYLADNNHQSIYGAHLAKFLSNYFLKSKAIP